MDHWLSPFIWFKAYVTTHETASNSLILFALATLRNIAQNKTNPISVKANDAY